MITAKELFTWGTFVISCGVLRAPRLCGLQGEKQQNLLRYSQAPQEALI
jgi:hypothetical protein